jgi:hypothetical protein
VVVLVALAIALRPNPGDAHVFGPLERYITYETTFFVSSRPGLGEPRIETWAWLSPEGASALPDYREWMKKQGWMMSQGSIVAGATRGQIPGSILPEEEMDSGLNHGSQVLIYSKRVSPAAAFFYRFLYKDRGINSLPPAPPQ